MLDTRIIKNAHSYEVLLKIILSAAFFILCVYASPFVRGTDQYWHMDNIQSILNGTLHANLYYPAMLLNPEWNGTAMPFIHNSPLFYLWSSFALLTDNNLFAALACNAAFAIGTAWIVAAATKTLSNSTYSLFAFVTFLFFPLTFWQTSQPLIEITATFFIICSLYFAFFKNNIWYKLCACLTAAMATIIREFLFIVMAFVFIVILYQAWKESKTRFVAALSCIGICGALIVCEALLLPDSSSAFGRSLLDNLYVSSFMGVPERSMLLWQVKPVAHSINDVLSTIITNYLGKVLLFFQQMLKPYRFSLFNYPIVGIIVINLLFSIYLRKEKRKFFVISLILNIITIITIVFMSVYYQYQSRYFMPFLPLQIVILYGSIASIFNQGRQKKQIYISLVLGIMVMCFLTTYVGYYNRIDSIQEHSYLEKVKNTFASQIGAEDVTILADVPEQLFAHALNQRKAIIVESSTYENKNYGMDKNDFAAMIESWEKNALGPKRLIIPNANQPSFVFSCLYEHFQMELVSTINDVSLYKLTPVE